MVSFDCPLAAAVAPAEHPAMAAIAAIAATATPE